MLHTTLNIVKIVISINYLTLSSFVYKNTKHKSLLSKFSKEYSLTIFLIFIFEIKQLIFNSLLYSFQSI